MTIQIRKAERKQKKAKIAVIGPAGSGKTMTALRLAAGLKNGGRILLLDTERGSSTLYADKVDFDQADLPDHEYETYLEGIKQAAAAGYDVLVIDSLSHAWESFLEMHEMEAARQRNSFTAWAKITPKYNELINAIISFPGHCIVTMRAKSDYVLSEVNGKQQPKKVGLAPIMRPGSEFEFDVVGIIDIDHNMAIEKTRLDWLADKIVKKPGEELGKQIKEWLLSGAAISVNTLVNTPPPAAPAAKTGSVAYEWAKVRAAYKELDDKEFMAECKMLAKQYGGARKEGDKFILGAECITFKGMEYGADDPAWMKDPEVDKALSDDDDD